jgi:hypothetical protein
MTLEWIIVGAGIVLWSIRETVPIVSRAIKTKEQNVPSQTVNVTSNADSSGKFGAINEQLASRREVDDIKVNIHELKSDVKEVDGKVDKLTLAVGRIEGRLNGQVRI